MYKPFLAAFLAVVALTSVSAFASQDPCEAPSINAAKKWARAHHVAGEQFTVSNFGQNDQGQSIYLVQLMDSRSSGDCWTNIAVTVQESADDTCRALSAEEDLSAESCS